MPIVDAHPHIYSPDRDAYPTIEEPWEPGEPASAEDLKKMMDAVGIDRAVFIQTSTFYGHDNRYVMDSAKQHADWACGVVTLDPDDKSHVDLLEDAVKNSNIRGMRGTTDSLSRIATPNVYRLWTKAMELGIPVNCMVMDDLERVPEIERIAQDLGDLKIIIDHCFMLNTRHKTEETLLALERLAKLPNVYAKLTAGTHGSYRVYPYVDMHDPLKRVIEAFSPSRCVWGSNFPNALWSKGASYAQNLHLFMKELGLSLPEKADILGITAMSLWFPGEHAEEELTIRKQKERTERESIQATEADEDPGDEDEGPKEGLGHSAEITMMADLIAAEGVLEGPIVDEVDDVEISAILDAANELNAVLDTVEFTPQPANTESVPESVEEAEGNSDVVVNLEDLMSKQNYTPIKTDEIGDAEVADAEVMSQVQEQLATAMKSVNETPPIELTGVEDGDEQELAIGSGALLTSEEPEDNDEAEIAADVQAQLAAAMEDVPEPPEIEMPVDEEEAEEEPVVDVEALLAAEESETPVVDDDESSATEEDEPTIDVEALLAAHDTELPTVDDADVTEAEETVVDVAKLLDEQVDSPAETVESSEAGPPGTPDQKPNPHIDPELDMSSVLNAANQLNAAISSMNEESPAVAENDPQPFLEPSEELESVTPETAAEPGDEEAIVDVAQLLAAQGEAPGEAVESEQPELDSEADSGDGEEMDLEALMDVANQLNSMLESVDDIASNINDLAAESESSDDQSDRPSA